MYIPAPLLKTGPNELMVLEMHRAERTQVVLTDTPDLGPTTPLEASGG